MKLAVHCAPSVNVCTPGWTVAVDAGAQAGAPVAVGAATKPIEIRTASAENAARTLRISCWRLVTDRPFGLRRRRPRVPGTDAIQTFRTDLSTHLRPQVGTDLVEIVREHVEPLVVRQEVAELGRQGRAHPGRPLDRI